MKEKFLDLSECTKRISTFSLKKPNLIRGKFLKLQGMKIPSCEFSLKKKDGMKNLQKMDIDSCELESKENAFSPESGKRISFVKAAYGAYKCCQNQDLHLFQLKKIFLEKSLLKGVIRWRLPKRKLVQQRLKLFADGFKLDPDTYKKHLVTQIVQVKNQDEEKNLNDQLELQKQRKESRNYQNNKLIF